VQGAQVLVEDQGRDDQEQQDRADQRGPEPDRLAVQPGDPDAQQPLAQRVAGQRGQDPRLGREERERPGLAAEEGQRQGGAGQPVNDQRAGPTPATERGPSSGSPNFCPG
jgi:hypothetical protein